MIVNETIPKETPVPQGTKQDSSPQPFDASLKEAVRLQEEIAKFMMASLSKGEPNEAQMFAYTALKSNQFIMVTRKELEAMANALYGLMDCFNPPIGSEIAESKKLQLISQGREVMDKLRQAYTVKGL